MIVGGKEIRISGLVCRASRLEGDGYDYVDDPARFLEELKQSSRRIDLFTFVQRASDPSRRYNYPMEWDNYAALQITTFDHWWMKQIGFKARNKAKQAAKHGVVVKEVPFDDKLVQGIWRIYNEAPIRQGRRFPHFGKSIEAVYREEATFLENSAFIGAFIEDELIGFIKLVWDQSGVQAGLMNIVSLLRHRDKAPTNALVAQAVRSCADRGIGTLVYSQFAYGSKERSTLSDFKERNGFARVDVPRYYVPLTPLGRVALRLRLHRRFIEWIPPFLTTKLLSLRREWYGRRYPSEVNG